MGEQIVSIPPSADTTLLQKFGVRFRENPKYLFNSHAVSATMRKWVNIIAFEYILKCLRPNCLTLAYCSTREVRLLKHSVYKVHEVLEIYRPNVEPTDVVRVVSPLPLSANFRRECVYMQDTYAAGGLSVYQIMKRFFESATVNTVVWVGHRFSGLFGDVYGEGAWYRDAAGFIHARPDAMLPPFPTSDPLDWLHRAGHAKTFAWTVLKGHGDEDIVVASRAEYPTSVVDRSWLQCVQLPALTNSYWVTLLQMVTLPSWVVRKIAGTHMEWFDQATIVECRNYLANKRPSTWVYQGLQRHASDWMGRTYPRFKLLWPEEWLKQTERHVDAAWLEFTFIGSERIQYISAFGMDSYSRTKAAATAIDNPQTSLLPSVLKTTVKTVGAMALLGACAYACYYNNPWLAMRTIGGAAVAKLLTYAFPTRPTGDGAWTLLKSLVPPLTKLPWYLDTFAGVLFEETINQHPYGRVVTATSEVAHGKWFMAPWHAVGFILPWHFRVPIHLAWNFGSREWNRVHGAGWRSWKLFHHDETVPFIEVHDDVERVATIELKDAWVPRRKRPLVLEPKKRCTLLKYEYDTQLQEDVVTAGSDTLYIWPTNVPLYAASNNGAQLLAAVQERILAEHPNYEAQLQNYRMNMSHMVHDLLPDLAARATPIPMGEPQLLQEWIEHFDDLTKRRQMLEVAATVERQRPTASHRAFNAVNLVIKLDEHLVRPTGEFKARTIASVDPIVQVVLGPSIRLATERLHTWWDGIKEYNRDVDYDHTFGVPPSVVRIRSHTKLKFVPGFATGWTDQRMGAWIQQMTHASQDTLGVMVVGDDSVVCACPADQRPIFLCADFSAYDQTEGRGPLEWGHIVLQAMGVSEAATDLLMRLAHAPYYARNKRGNRIKIDRADRPMRDTGGPDTTIGNSAVNVSAWYLVAEHVMAWAALEEAARVAPQIVAHCKSAKDAIVAAFLDLGFKIKLKTTRDPLSLEFLKGTFARDDQDHLVWIPLPSRFLKMGKCIRDPRQTYGYKPGELQLAALHHMKAVAASYQAYADVPILRAFVARFYDPAIRPCKRQLRYMVQGTNVHLNGPAVLQQLCERYEMPAAAFSMVESWIRTVPLFTFFEHPLFAALAQDYA